jgi:hypothetical protein
MAQNTAAVAFRAGLNACQAQQAHFDSRLKAGLEGSKWERQYVVGKGRRTDNLGQ